MKAFEIFAGLAMPLISLAAATSAQELEEAKKAVVKITSQAEGQNRIGTGFIARLDTDAAYIVTASHVIEGDSKPQVCFYPDVQTCRPATVIGSEGDLPRGLALIRVTGLLPSGLSHLGIDATFDLQSGEQVTIIGFPRLAATPWAVTPITIAGRQGTAITFSGAADEGSSGSPVIRNGWVTALVVEKSGDFGYAVPAAALRFAIEGWGLNLVAETAANAPVKHASPESDARLSGTRILFVSTRDIDSTGRNDGDIYVMDISGKNVKRMPGLNGIDAHDAGWSRDGGSITYVVDGDPKMAGIYKTKFADSSTTTIFQEMAYYGCPVWSPDGKRLAFLANTSVEEDERDVFVLSGNGGRPIRLTHNPSRKISLFWSPEGDRIGYAEESKKHLKTFLMNADGTNLRPLSSPLTDFAADAWSPRDNKLLGESIHEGYSAIYTVNEDGSEPTRLTNNPQGDGDADWSPDGTKIVFTSQRDGHEEIYLMNADGSNQVRLTSGQASSFGPQWSPFPK